MIDDLAKPHTYGIYAGDLLDGVRTHARQSIGVYRATGSDKLESLDDSMAATYDRFLDKWLMPVRHKIFCASMGNHMWEFSDGTNSDQHIARRLGCYYGDQPTYIRWRISAGEGRNSRVIATLSILIHHGNWASGYSTIGGDLQSVVKKTGEFPEMDIYIFSHTHRKYGVLLDPSLYIRKTGVPELVERPRVAIRTGTFTRTYATNCMQPHYAHKKLLPPTQLGHVKLEITFKADYDHERFKKKRDARLARGLPHTTGGAASNMYHRFKVIC